jgi:hypothetical protein
MNNDIRLISFKKNLKFNQIAHEIDEIQKIGKI